MNTAGLQPLVGKCLAEKKLNYGLLIYTNERFQWLTIMSYGYLNTVHNIYFIIIVTWTSAYRPGLECSQILEYKKSFKYSIIQN